MPRAPIAFLWQNAVVMSDGYFDFFPSSARADDEIARRGGWKTPVFILSVAEYGNPNDPHLNVFDGLDHHRPGDRLDVRPSVGNAIVAYMRAVAA